jgi:hypothetical protein
LFYDNVGDIMHTYYLFIIKKDAFKLYYKNTEILFEILKCLYELDRKNFVYGLSVYHQVCTPISVKLLSNYIIEKVPACKLEKNTFKMLSFFENTTVFLHYSNIIVKTDKVLPAIYNIFHVYSENILICDFQEKRYFWLDEVLKNGNPVIKKHIMN